jgi:hypothetical protein
MPEMASWKTWRRGLERVLRRELKRADVNSDDEQRTIEAVLFDRGTVPSSAELIALPYLARMCSEGRYNAGRSTALLTRRIHLELRRVYIPPDQETFIERIERMRRLTRDELIAQTKRDAEEQQRIQALSWHLEDLACISVMAANRLRRAGVTPAQRTLAEIVEIVVERVGTDASLRIPHAHWWRIASGVAADELRKRNTRIRVEPAKRIRVADSFPTSNEQDILADEEARASADAAEQPRVRKARAT